MPVMTINKMMMIIIIIINNKLSTVIMCKISKYSNRNQELTPTNPRMFPDELLTGNEAKLLATTSTPTPTNH